MHGKGVSWSASAACWTTGRGPAELIGKLFDSAIKNCPMKAVPHHVDGGTTGSRKAMGHYGNTIPRISDRPKCAAILFIRGKAKQTEKGLPSYKAQSVPDQWHTRPPLEACTAAR